MQVETGVITHNVTKKRYLDSVKLMSTFQKKKSKQYLTLILTFAALTIFGVFAINPTISTIVQLQKQLEDSKALDKKLDEKITSIQSLQREYELLKPDLPLLSAAIPLSPETPTLIGQIRSLAGEHNLTFNAIEMENVPYTKEGLEAGTTGSYLITFTLSGDYANIQAFITEAVNFDRLILLDEVVIARDTENPASLNSSATIKAYFDQQPL